MAKNLKYGTYTIHAWNLAAGICKILNHIISGQDSDYATLYYLWILCYYRLQQGYD